MKRYITTLALVLLAAAGFSTYYAFGSADHLPEYRLETLEGDVNEAANLVLVGSYIGGKGSQPLNLTVHGSEYRSRKSLYESYITDAREWFYEREGMRELIEKYPAFMRGKSEINSFYQDQDWLAYAEIPYNSATSDPEGTIEVEMLNRSTGKTADYSIALTPFTQQGMREHATLYDVQLQADGLHVMVKQYETDNKPSGASQYFDYIIDSASGQLVKRIALEFVDAAGTKLTPLSSAATQNDYTAPNDYFVLSIVTQEQTGEANSSSVPANAPAELYVYSYKSGTTQRLPDEMQKLDARRMGGRYISGGDLYFTNYNETQFSVSSYSLETGERRGDSWSLLSSQIGEGELQSFFINGDRLYVLLAKEDARTVVVMNAATGESLYKGSVTVEGSEEERQIALSDMALNNMSIKE
ncbi:hypothetical protein BBD42_04795 [Paenibacillus sp. BIHB 4019]|uniref:Uncharacterized protein n=1 Tax=Paenibacillus sp. BIHB 4019 TaxID=1870819 RepID=A0A1B2DDS3_9BACL|nr:hypothetical protein [Paenibacillus sp. BIHB 4019]ANY65859.1 hypothetical protein BBD42_04795 [Paenibacillus sp. BIHB 4019]